MRNTKRKSDGESNREDLSSTAEEPLFVVSPPLIAPIALGVVLAPIALLVLGASALGSTLILGAYALLLVWYFSRSSTYEFYESHFIRKSRGTVRQRADYADVVSYRYNPSEAPLRSPQIVITARADGQDSAFIVVGDPDNEELDATLSEWLAKQFNDESSKTR